MLKSAHKENITIDFGVEQYQANDREPCGNAYKHFYDGDGHFVMILSDGMGDNERAAVESKMAVDLIAQSMETGFEYNRAFDTINSSLLSKSSDESLVTVDITSVDLCTGLAEFYKAGAAPSIVCQNGRVKEVGESSLPAGILRDINLATSSFKCNVSDIVVMMSDGATSEGCEWIKNELASFRDGNAQDLAKHLCMCALKQSAGKCENDITILCAILNKAV